MALERVEANLVSEGVDVNRVLCNMRVDGTLLLTRGVQVAAGVLERMRNFPAGTVREPIRVSVCDDGGDELRRMKRTGSLR